MWECQACHSVNDESARFCPACGAAAAGAGPAPVTLSPPPAGADITLQLPTPSGEQTATYELAAASAPAVPEPTVVMDAQAGAAPAEKMAPAGQPKSQRARRKVSWEMIALLVIVLSLAAVAAVGYFAWQRGYLGGLAQYAPWLAGPDGAQDGLQAGDAGQAEQAALEETDPLLALKYERGWNLRPFRRSVNELLKLRDEIANPAPGAASTAPVSAPAGAAGSAASDAGMQSSMATGLAAQRSARLASLAATGERLLALYQRFEQTAAKRNSAKQAEFALKLRGEFQARFAELLTRLGAEYAVDAEGSNSAYLLPDRLFAELAAYPELDLGLLKKIWLDAGEARRQMLLDQQLELQYQQLQRRLGALAELRRRFEEATAAIPPYGVHNGVLDDSAEQYLDVLEKMATSVEDLQLEFEEFRPALSEDAGSARLDGYVKKFEEAAQGQHQFCFTEIYKMYAKDRDLLHPAYERLKEHYGFVRAHWPQLDGTYRALFDQYEGEWDSMWRGK